MPRTTIGSTAERIRRQLASAFRYEVSMLGASMNTTDTTVQLVGTVDMPPSVREGAVLSVGRESMRVLGGVDTAAKTAVVIRGWQDSDAATHAIGDEVWINPRFSAIDIYDTIVAELQSWGPDLYRVATEEVSVTDGTQTLALPATFLGAYGILALNAHKETTAYWPFGENTAWPAADYRLMRAPVGSTAGGDSGMMLRFVDSSVFATGRLSASTLLVQAAMPFDTSAIDDPSTDLIADVGLAESMLDVLEMGVKWRLLGDQENQRSARVAQDTPRMAEETPAMAAQETGQRIWPIYNRRKSEEISRLRWRYPLMVA